MATVLTRHDTDVGIGEFDSIAWALEVHVGIADSGEYQFAILEGNEDWPDNIEFYVAAEPTVYDEPAFVWCDPDIYGEVTQ